MFSNPICNCICCCIVIVLQNKIACHLMACVGFHCLWRAPPIGNRSTWLPCVERSTAHPLVLHSLAGRSQGGLSHASQLVPGTSYQKNQIYSWCPCLWGYISQLCVDMLLCPSPWGLSPQVRFSTTQPPGTQEPHEPAARNGGQRCLAGARPPAGYT